MAELGVVKPVTTHTIAPTAEPGAPMASFKLGEVYVGVTVPPNALLSAVLVHDAVALPLRVKEAKPDTVITAADVAVVPVNPMVTVEETEMRLAEKAMEAAVNAAPNMGGTATPAKVSRGAKPELTPKVDIVEVAAAAAALGVVKPATMHTIAAFKPVVVVRTSFKLGEEYVGVIVPMSVPALVHVAVGVPVKEVKPDNVITAAAVDVAPVNAMVMEVEAVETGLLGKKTEAAVNAAANMAGTATPGKASIAALVEA